MQPKLTGSSVAHAWSKTVSFPSAVQSRSRVGYQMAQTQRVTCWQASAASACALMARSSRASCPSRVAPEALSIILDVKNAIQPNHVPDAINSRSTCVDLVDKYMRTH